MPQHASADPTATGQPKPKRQMASFLDTRMSRMGQMGQRSGETSITVNVTDATGVDEQLATTGASAPTSPMRASTAEPQSDALDPAPAIDTTVSDVADAPAPPVSAAAPLDGWTSHRRLVDADVVAPAEVATDSPRSALVPDGGQHSGQDGAAELLRPVLRQWLADNMPRIVERALHMELAAGVKPRGPKSDN